MTFSRKSVLVTGGAGFLGSHLCMRLLESKSHVICVDNFHTGARENIEHLIGVPGFDIIEHDVTVPLNLGVDQIYNLACPASPVHYQTDPIQTTKTCVLGSLNVLEMARSSGASILQASTSEIYGEPLQHPQQETYWGHVNPIGMRSCYDEGKRCAESLFADYRRQHGTNTKIARIFNTFGPKMAVDDGRVVSNFVVHALLGKPIRIHSDGLQTRSFCYVDDTIEGLIRLMDTPDNYGGPVNLGNPLEIAVIDLAELIKGLVGSRSEIVFAEQLSDDPTRRRPDISRASKDLHWAPKVALDEGLHRTIEYFDARLRGSLFDGGLAASAGTASA